MALRVSGKNFDIGEALRNHVIGRVDAATEKYFDGHVAGHVIIDHEGPGYRSDCTLHLGTGVTLHAIGMAHDPYASFDQAAARLEKRLRRHKSRLKGHHAARHDAEAGTIADTTFEKLGDDFAEVEEYHPVVIAEQTRGLRTMAVADAVIELDFTGLPVVAFQHAMTRRVNVVYRRADGNIGWLDLKDANAETR